VLPSPIVASTTPGPAVQRFRIDAVAGTLDRGGATVLGAGNGGPATGARFATITALAVSADGDIYIADSQIGARPGNVSSMVRRVDHRTGLIQTLAGPTSLGYVWSLAFTPGGDLLIGGNYSAAAIWRLRTGRLEPFAGTGHSGDRGDGGPAIDATIYGPAGLAYDGAGSLDIADWNDARIRRIKPDGTVESYGTAPPVPFGFAVDRAGNAYVASNNVAGTRIYRIAPDGTGTIIAGSGGLGGSGGDGGPAIDARFGSITALTLGPDGSLYVLDADHRVIRRIDPSGIVTTIAGTGHPGYTGDGGDALAADLGDSPMYLAAGPAGSLYLATTVPGTVRKVTPIP
jgi:WD40 repeat protein